MTVETSSRRDSVLGPLTDYRTDPATGQLSLSDESLKALLNTDPIDTVYVVDALPFANGQFAAVRQCRHRHTGDQYAAKYACRSRLGADATPAIVHEVAVNALLATCPRLIKLQDVFSDEKDLILVMEFACGGDLQTLIDENVVFYERHVINFLRQLLEGLVFIHDRSIVHLDIKPQNLVLMGEFPDCAVKLCDFEIARLLTPGHEVREIRGTPDYVAPEILHYEPITTKTDMWSLGVLTYVLLTGFLPFGGDSDQETFMQISWGELDFPNELFEDITPEAIDFMKKLLIREPEQRMSAQECLQHPWMKNNPPSLRIPNIAAHQNVTRTESSPSVVTTEEPSDTGVVIGRPPLHPRCSQQSLSGVPGEVSNTLSPLAASTLSKESKMGSRQNLNRLRSMSKSREVLSERIQMSNLKKSISKSRERLFDARFGLSTSTEDLQYCPSFSQSVEALTALSQLHQNGALYKSCNNIFIPMIHLVNKQLNAPERMFQSLASIDKIPGNDLKKIGYFESRLAGDEDYNDLITQRNTNMNIVITEVPSGLELSNEDLKKMSGLRGNTCRGGRGAEGSDRICTRHKHPEAQSTQNIRKLSKSEKMKKDVQKRRKEKKERETKERQRKFSLNENCLKVEKSSEGSISPTFRRGSVCHVEQRLQERHERLMEKQERAERKVKGSGAVRRLDTIHQEKSPPNQRKKSVSKYTNSTDEDRSRSVTPSRKCSKSDSARSSDVSQASSMENVTSSYEELNKMTHRRRSKISPPSTSSLLKSVIDKVEHKVKENCYATNNNSLDFIENKDQDEAYVSLEDQSHTFEDEPSSPVIEENSTENLSTKELLKIFQNSTNKADLKPESHGFVLSLPLKNECVNEERRERKKSQILSDISDLTSIKEERPKCKRSISLLSDVGSTFSLDSEMSDASSVASSSKTCAEKQKSENTQDVLKTRNRSNSVQPTISQPWGEVCSGSIAKALKNFTMSEGETKPLCNAHKRRQSSPPLT